jgi:hypothetical protein
LKSFPTISRPYRQNEVQQMLILGREAYLGADLLSARVLRTAPDADDEGALLLSGLEGSLKERVEARIECEPLIGHRWNKSRAAKELGLSRVGLRSKLKRYGLEKHTAEQRPGTLVIVPAQGNRRGGYTLGHGGCATRENVAAPDPARTTSAAAGQHPDHRAPFGFLGISSIVH